MLGSGAVPAVTFAFDDSPAQADDTALSRISRRMVQIQKEYYGRGPTKAKTYLQDDLLVVLMRGGFNRVEDTLLEEGRADSVMTQRAAFQEVMHERYSQIVAEETGRAVEAFMSGNHQRPDLLCEVFILAPSKMSDGDAPTDEPAPE